MYFYSYTNYIFFNKKPMTEDQNKVIKISMGEMFLIEHDIIFCKYNNIYLDSVEYLDEMGKAVLELATKDQILFLLDSTQVKGASKEFRLASSKNQGNTKAVAILIGNMFTKILANIFIKFNNPGYPTKMFVKREEAIKWLLSFD